MMERPTIRTCLWFARDGEEAAEFYVSLLPRSRIDAKVFADPRNPAVVIEFTLGEAPYMILNGGPTHTLTPAASISVTTADQIETDALWAALLAGGGEEGRCGLSWQIIPQALRRMLGADDKAAAARAQAAMMTMTKIDIGAIEAAFNGG